jgi:hypothetical protein
MLFIQTDPCHRKATPILFAGVDLHKHTIAIAVVDAARMPVTRKRFSNLHTNQNVAFLKSHGLIQLTVEATASCEWFVQLVEALATQGGQASGAYSRSSGELCRASIVTRSH